MLLHVLEMRDHLLVCELDLETVQHQSGHVDALAALGGVVGALAQAIEHLADALLTGRHPTEVASYRPQLVDLPWAPAGPNAIAAGSAMLARGLANRVGHLNDETLHLLALARGDAQADVALVRTYWQMFVSPTTWSWQPFLALWHWDAPPLRHALRAALAIGTAYAVGLALPWGTHDYWILLTIVVVLRGSLAQTLERRNLRLAGTLMGCLLAAGLLSAHLHPLVLLMLVTLAQGLAHAFAIKRYLVTAVAATVLGLLQAHLLSSGTSPGFNVLERVGDTLLGVAIAWAFSYVLPSWERGQLPALVRRSVAAQARHAQVALALGQLHAVDNEPELGWRLARREAYDSLSALVLATQRSLSEPRVVRPPLEPLGRLMAHSYQLLAQLTVVKTMLLRRRGRLTPDQIDKPLEQVALQIVATLTQKLAPTSVAVAAAQTAELSDPFEGNLSPWLLHRLEGASGVAVRLRQDADRVLAELQR